MPQLFYLLLHLLFVPITYCVCREKRNAQVTGANGRTRRNRRISSIAGSAASQDQQHRRNSGNSNFVDCQTFIKELL
jgi:hypothetical protein